MQFKDFDLHPDTLKAIEEMGYITPTPVQELTITEIMQGNDVLASARTGTGKTAAFLLPLINKIVSQGQKAWLQFAQVLLSSSEFIYVNWSVRNPRQGEKQEFNRMDRNRIEEWGDLCSEEPCL